MARRHKVRRTSASKRGKLTAINTNFSGHGHKVRSRKNKQFIAPFKKRHIFSWKNRSLLLGGCGLRLLTKLYYTKRLFKRVRVSIKYFLTGDIHSRNIFIWIRSLFSIVMTRKPKKFRMGKGKGKLKYYLGTLYAGSVFIEVSDYKLDSTAIFLRTVLFKLPAKAIMLTQMQYLCLTYFSFFSNQHIFFLQNYIEKYKRARPLFTKFLNKKWLPVYTDFNISTPFLRNAALYSKMRAITGFFFLYLFDLAKYLNTNRMVCFWTLLPHSKRIDHWRRSRRRKYIIYRILPFLRKMFFRGYIYGSYNRFLYESLEPGIDRGVSCYFDKLNENFNKKSLMYILESFADTNKKKGVYKLDSFQKTNMYTYYKNLYKNNYHIYWYRLI